MTALKPWICPHCRYPLSYHQLAGRTEGDTGVLDMHCPDPNASVEDVAPIDANRPQPVTEEKAAGWATFIVATGFVVGSWVIVAAVLYGVVKLLRWVF